MYQLLPVLWQRHFDSNGDPLSGGKLYSYIAGTTTPRGTYADSEGTPNTNPVILDADGYADVWIIPGGGAYKFILTDADDVPLKTIDDVTLAEETDTATGWSTFDITDGQAATDLDGETIDFDDYSSATYECEITRGTTVRATGSIAVQSVNGTGRVVTGVFLANEAHGVTFSVSQTGTVATLRAAASTGPGDGTIKLRRLLVPI